MNGRFWNEKVKNKHWQEQNNNSIFNINRKKKKIPSKPGIKTIFDIKFVNTISFQSCINIYTHVWKMHAVDWWREREREKREKSEAINNNRMLIISELQAHGQSCWSFACIHLNACVCDCTLHCMKQFAFAQTLKCFVIFCSVPFHRANDANRDKKKSVLQILLYFFYIYFVSLFVSLTLKFAAIFFSVIAVAVAGVRTLVCVR